MKKDKNPDTESMYDSYRKYGDSAVFSLAAPPDEKEISVVAKLNSILEKMGGDAKITQYEADGETYHYLNISLPRDVEKVYGRCAGRKRKTDYYTSAELERMVAESGVDAAAAQLGISRASFYRRLKEAKEFESQN